MATIGEELRRERQRKGLTIHDVEQVLHIRAAYLTALESDNFKEIPGTVFCKGFLRNYSRYLGLDAERLVGAYKNQIGDRESVPLHRLKTGKMPHRDGQEMQRDAIFRDRSRMTYQGRKERRRRTMIRERIALGVILFFVVIFLIWLFLL